MEFLETLHPDIQQSLYKFHKSVDIDTGVSLVEWICDNTFLNGEPFSFQGYEYCIQPVEDVYPRQFILKAAQVGATETMMRKVLAILMKYSLTPFYYQEEGSEEEKCVLGIRGIYSFPNENDVRDFVKDRVQTKAVRESPTLMEAVKTGQSESLSLLSFHGSFLYSMGRGSEAKVQSIPAEIVAVDEYDQGKNLTIRDMLYARLKKAQVFKNKYHTGLYIGYGTPTIPEEDGFLISGKFELSDQHEWMIKCTRCHHWQQVIYPDSMAHFYEKGDKKPAEEPYWMCLSCKEKLNFHEIGKWDRNDPHKTHNSEWVAKYPDRTKNGSGIRGYRFPFATLHNTAARVLSARDTDYRHSTKDFHNFALGQPYRDSLIQIVADDLYSNINPDLRWGVYDEDYIHVMGIDQGSYITIVRLKPDSRTDINPVGVGQMVYCEHSKDMDAFSRVEKVKDNRLDVRKGRISKLIEYWKPKVVVIDRLPNAALADNLALEFIDIVWRNHSSGSQIDRLKVELKDEDENVIKMVKENKHLVLESYFDAIKSHYWEYAKDDGGVLDIFVKHHLAVHKESESDNIGKDGINRGHLGVRYFKLGNKPDHYCQAGKYASQALEIYSVINPKDTRIGCLSLVGLKIGG